jgi:peptide/nickel transport system permease protein
MPDYVLRIFAILFLAMPNFWVATMVLLYVVRWHLFTVPITDQPLLWDNPWASLRLYAIPAVVGGLASGAGVMRLLRSQMLEVLRQDYVRTARSKGLKERTVVVRHALRNAAGPTFTMGGLQFGLMLGGVVVVEQIFAWPGLGLYLDQSIGYADFPAITGTTILLGTAYVIVNFLVDLAQAWADPRIRTV